MRECISKLIRKILTRKVTREIGISKKMRVKEVPPSERLVLLVQFSIGSLVALTILEVVHILYFGSWNAEIFVAITGLIGTVTGLFIGAKA